MLLLQGAAINHKQAVSAKRTAIRNEINEQLRKSRIWPDLKIFSHVIQQVQLPRMTVRRWNGSITGGRL